MSLKDQFYVGMDLASATMGLIVLDGEQSLIHASRLVTVAAKFPDKWERYMTTVNFAVEVLTPFVDKIDSLFIEAYGGAHKNSLIPAIECGTLMRQALYHLGLRSRVVEIPPMSLKAFTHGSGNAKKEHMIAEVYKKYGWMAPDADQADAYALAIMALKSSIALDSRDKKLLAYERKALEKLKL